MYFSSGKEKGRLKLLLPRLSFDTGCDTVLRNQCQEVPSAPLISPHCWLSQSLGGRKIHSEKGHPTLQGWSTEVLKRRKALGFRQNATEGNKISLFNYFHDFNERTFLEKSLHYKLLSWPQITNHASSFQGDDSTATKVYMSYTLVIYQIFFLNNMYPVSSYQASTCEGLGYKFQDIFPAVGPMLKSVCLSGLHVTQHSTLSG